MSRRKEIKLQHAIHNRELCLAIDKMEKYPDWVVTVAFYSVLHFVDYKIFPLQMKDNNDTAINNIMQYADYQEKRNGIRKSNHKHRENLVRKNLPDISEYFNSLLRFSSSARYYNYQVDDKTKQFSIQILKKIEKICSKK